MKLLDLFCGAGGAAMGYNRADLTAKALSRWADILMEEE